MIAALMLHAALVSAVVALAALALEHAARALGRPVRFIWLGALIAAVEITVVGFLDPTSAVTGSALAASEQGIAPATPAGSVDGQSREAVRMHILPPLASGVITVPGWLARFDRPLLVTWIAASLLWLAVLAGAAVRLHRRKGAWRAAVVQGVPVYVSHDTGPALFGLFRYSIVLPAWVLELDSRKQELILAHEREHASMADPVTMLAGALLAVLQPWNPATWLMFRRLRFAIESDCDARVLARNADVRAYGELLVDVGERTLAGAAPLIALSEPRSNLERRIAIMTQHPLSRPMIRGAALLLLGSVLGVAACQLPRPTTGPDYGSAALPVQTALQDQGGQNARPGSGAASERVIIRLVSVGVHDAGAEPVILVFATGRVRVGLGRATPTLLTDTLRLNGLPAMTLDVTEGDLHIMLAGPGRLQVEGTVAGGPATRIGAGGPHIILLKGGEGATHGMPVVAPDSALVVQPSAGSATGTSRERTT